MAKRDRLFDNETVTIQINERVLTYLEELAKTGLYGNTYEQAAAIVFRLGLKGLIESKALPSRADPLPKLKEGGKEDEAD